MHVFPGTSVNFPIIIKNTGQDPQLVKMGITLQSMELCQLTLSEDLVLLLFSVHLAIAHCSYVQQIPTCKMDTYVPSMAAVMSLGFSSAEGPSPALLLLASLLPSSGIMSTGLDFKVLLWNYHHIMKWLPTKFLDVRKEIKITCSSPWHIQS